MATKDRDLKVIKFLNDFKVANTNQLAEMFFKSTRYAQLRLKDLVHYGEIKRSREFVIQQYLYYLKKPPKKALRHRLAITEFFVKLNQLVKVEDYMVQKRIDNIEPDLFIIYNHKGISKMAFAEYQFRTNPFNLDKYIRFYHSNKWKELGFPVFPTLIAITEQDLKEVNEFKVIQLKEDLSDIDKIIAR